MLSIPVKADPSPTNAEPLTVPTATIPPEAFMVTPETVPVAVKFAKLNVAVEGTYVNGPVVASARITWFAPVDPTNTG